MSKRVAPDPVRRVPQRGKAVGPLVSGGCHHLPSLEARHLVALGALDMHQRQTSGGDQALDGAQGNTELVGGFALGHQQSPGHNPRIERARQGVKDWHVLTFPAQQLGGVMIGRRCPVPAAAAPALDSLRGGPGRR